MTDQRQPGDQIEVRFLIGNDPFLVIPVTVVEDREDRIAHFLQEGTQYLRRRLTDGSAVPRVVTLDQFCRLDTHLEIGEWQGSRQLIVSRPGAAHSVRLRWDTITGAFRGWYVNLQEPVQRTSWGFTSRDQFLDILVAPDRSWAWKDEDELEEAVDVGRLTREDADAVRVEGERLVADIESRCFPFDDSLLEWRPDPEWTLPDLSSTWRGIDESASHR